MFFASIPNLAQYLAEAQSVFSQKLAREPRTARAGGARKARDVEPIIEKLRAASEYLGDES